ncbi:DnaJ family domain-containing protein [Polyangium mundeleinium]|uniref:DUF1992 domain-containing protein n=1 Tax=Polyangium mundeleinium TaxID=2995306 RepID=A0ABT5ELV8_9BACT|nr:DUF1992 domain-containing protein [Polyangium mundeleinium]MDC0742746.1 DUF1992 domain-containing protein [Polyangium mundeleinium]
MRSRDFHVLVEARIREAEARGSFEDLPGKGKPMPADDLAGLPAEDRMAARIQRIAGSAPEEVELLRDIAALRERLAACKHEKERAKLTEALGAKTTRLAILFEASGRNVLVHSKLTEPR